MKISRIILDMDELLSDFIGGAANLWGYTTEQVVKEWPLGKWEMQPALSVLEKRHVPLVEFWDRINGLEWFWADLKILPWANDLLFLTKEVVKDNWHVVSSPSHCQTSYNGKVTWIKDRFGKDFSRFALTPHKEIFAQPGVLLIDDRESNVETFRKHGGDAILFPAHHNSNHAFKTDPVLYVYEQLKERKCI